MKGSRVHGLEVLDGGRLFPAEDRTIAEQVSREQKITSGSRIFIKFTIYMNFEQPFLTKANLESLVY